MDAQNNTTNIYKACKLLKTDRRVALTGYPLQNNLNEYYQMLLWAQGDFGLSKEQFREDFANVVIRGETFCVSKGQQTYFCENAWT